MLCILDPGIYTRYKKGIHIQYSFSSEFKFTFLANFMVQWLALRGICISISIIVFLWTDFYCTILKYEWDVSSHLNRFKDLPSYLLPWKWIQHIQAWRKCALKPICIHYSTMGYIYTCMHIFSCCRCCLYIVYIYVYCRVTRFFVALASVVNHFIISIPFHDLKIESLLFTFLPY